MGIKSDYASTIRAELGRYAVWQPGSTVALGDYGVLRDRTFEKLGNVGEFLGRFDVEIGSQVQFEFTSTGTVANEVKGEASVDGVGKSTVEYRFASDRGLVIKTQDSDVRSISNIFQLCRDLREARGWNFDWKIVSSLQFVSAATVLMSRDRNASIKIEGTLDAIEQFKAGKATASTGLSISGSVGYQVLGVTGPLLVDLVRLRRVWNGVAHASGPGENLDEEPFIRVSPNLTVADDST